MTESATPASGSISSQAAATQGTLSHTLGQSIQFAGGGSSGGSQVISTFSSVTAFPGIRQFIVRINFLMLSNEGPEPAGARVFVKGVPGIADNTNAFLTATDSAFEFTGSTVSANMSDLNGATVRVYGQSPTTADFSWTLSTITILGEPKPPSPDPGVLPDITREVDVEIEAASVGGGLDFFASGRGITYETDAAEQVHRVSGGAQVLLSNTSSRVWSGIKFVAAQDLDLAEAIVRLKRTGDASWDMINAYIYSDNAGTPGTQLFYLGQRPDGFVPLGAHSDQLFSPLAPVKFRDELLRLGPLHYWRMGQTGDQVSEAGTEPGTLTANATITSPSGLLAGDTDGAKAFATAGWFSSVTPAYDQDKSWTLGLWLHRTSASTTGVILSVGAFGLTGVHLFQNDGSSNINAAGGNLQLDISGTLLDLTAAFWATPSQVIITHDSGNTVNVWWNGALIKTDSGGSHVTPDPLTGVADNLAGTGPTNRWTGTVDEIFSFDRVLSESEIRGLAAIGNYRNDSSGSVALTNTTTYWLVVNRPAGGTAGLDLENGSSVFTGGIKIAQDSAFATVDETVNRRGSIVLREPDSRGFSVRDGKALESGPDLLRWVLTDLAGQSVDVIDQSSFESRELPSYALAGSLASLGVDPESLIERLAEYGVSRVTMREGADGPLYEIHGPDLPDYGYPAPTIDLSGWVRVRDSLHRPDQMATRFRAMYAPDLSSTVGNEDQYQGIVRADPDGNDTPSTVSLTQLELKRGRRDAPTMFLSLHRDGVSAGIWLGWQVELRGVSRSSISGTHTRHDGFGLWPGMTANVITSNGAAPIKCQVFERRENIFEPVIRFTLEEVP